MATTQSKKDKETITKALIEHLEKSVHYLHGASMLMKKLQTDQKTKKDIDYLGYTGADIEQLIAEYQREFANKKPNNF